MDNKPLETDDQEESNEDVEELFDEPAEETPQEPGNEDVGGKSDFVKKMEELAKRTFKDEEDVEKHYKHLASFVGKKKEPAKPKPSLDELGELKDKVEGLTEAVKERDFIFEAPEAKEHLSLVKAWAKDKGIPLKEAFDQVKPYIEGAEASKKDKVTVDSKPRITPTQVKKRQELEKAVKEGGGEAAEHALLKEYGLL